MPDRNTSGHQDERKDRDNQQRDRDDKDQRSSGSHSSGSQKKGRNNPGNFANDPQRASEAGRKGGRS